jgi:NAD(P)-dependent dehydrogenase (short-subunit alcohol dehydrogenase family)
MKPITLITGASRGIGAATARWCVSQGHAVVLNYRSDEAAAMALQKELLQRGGAVLVVQADVALEADVQRLFDTVDDALGRLSYLINNAGVVDAQTRVEEITLEQWQRMFSVNVLGSFLCAREAIRRMSTKHGGRGGAIVNVSSTASRLGAPGRYVHYAASKGAIDSFTQGLAQEVAAEGIRVNAVRPGIIDTDIHASGGQPDRARTASSQIPMQRAGSADEVARAIGWLLSDAASYTTGAILDVSGGR